MTGVFTLSPDRCFVTELAQGLLARAEGDPLKLSRGTIFLPTRRACLSLRDAFLRVSESEALLLPRLSPLGDIDEEEIGFSEYLDLADLPPAIAPLRRKMLLLRLIRKKDPSLPMRAAAMLAQTLAGLLDQLHTEGKGVEELKNSAVPENCSKYWKETLVFLEIVTNEWPRVLEEEKCLDPARRRDLALDALARSWSEKPPPEPVMIAGSTGSVPAVGRLMKIVAGLPFGEVVLPGLDVDLDEETWQVVDESHPQYTMKAWLDSVPLRRDEIRYWEDKQPVRPSRLLLFREALRPADVTEKWRELARKGLPDTAVEGLEKMELAHHRQEAEIIALALRAALEDEKATAALVTADRSLARRVVAALARWDIKADDSAGTPFDMTPLGAFLISLLAAAAPDASPLDMLSLLKHPFSCLGHKRGDFLSLTRKAEILVWRGVRGKGGFSAAARQAHEKDERIGAWLREIASVFAPLRSSWNEKRSVSSWIEAHVSIAEKIASMPGEEGEKLLWRSQTGERAALWLAEWKEASVGCDVLDGKNYAQLFSSLAHGEIVRPVYGTHARVSVLGPLEARLMHHDLIVLGGLNEDSWPPAIPIDPWLSRPMKSALSLPLPERRTGLSAHDFVGLTAAPRVIMTRARRVEGAPAQPSRFLLQIQAVLRAASREDLKTDAPWESWARRMDCAQERKSIAPPSPTPPVEARPRRLSVTKIGTWQRNPYAIYADYVLRLKKLDDIDADVGAPDKGSAIHEALENFMREAKDRWPENPSKDLLSAGLKVFSVYEEKPQIKAFWWPRFEIAAARFLERQEQRRMLGASVLSVEAKGETEIEGVFTLVGKADRVDFWPGKGIEIIDYKTGTIPAGPDVRRGIEPQLPLLSILAQAGAFEGVEEQEVARVSYWSVKGGEKEEKEIFFVNESLKLLVKEAREGLARLVRIYSKKETPYMATPRLRFALKDDDYEHLARAPEWGARGEEE